MNIGQVNKSSENSKQKTKREKRAAGFFIDGQFIRYSFRAWVMGFTKDRELTARFLLRAHEAKAKSIVGWIKDGIGVGGWCWNACALETDNPGAVRAWIDENINGVKPGGPEKLSSAMVPVLEEMLKMAKGES